MHAIEIEHHGGPEVLEYKEVPSPTPREGEVLVDVEAIGVNYGDVYEREGLAPYARGVPGIVGGEGAGRIVDTGEHVAWIGVPGSYAERVAADSERLVPVPEGVSSEVATAAMLQGMTAYYLASDSYPVEQGDWVLVHAGAGGVGHLLIQIAKLRGGRVITTTSTGEKAALARGAGADEAIGYRDFVARVREITGGEGVAAVFDGVGKATFLDGLNTLRPLGRMILYGYVTGRPDRFDLSLLGTHGSLYVQEPTIKTYVRTPELLRERAGALFELIAEGKLDVRVGQAYPLSQARQAHEDLEARRTSGKLVLLPGR